MKSMKAPALKKISVKCSTFWEDEFEIDPKFFDDVLMEAATRAIDKRKNVPGFKVAVMIECWEKKHESNPNKHFGYNTYFVMLNAGMHQKAEMLRLNFYKQHKIDLQKESLKPESKNGRDKSKPGLN